MYKYVFVESEAQGLFTPANHRAIIEEYAKKGYRFVTAIETRSTGHGKAVTYDLVFEMKE